MKEKIAIAEARKLNIPTFAIVDTNSDPTLVDFPIPANDDASKSIALILDVMTKAIEEGMMERKLDRDKEEEDNKEEVETKRINALDDTDEVDSTKRPRKRISKLKDVEDKAEKNKKK